VTTHCHAATALLTRGYQGDHRRKDLTSSTPCPTPLTSPSISGVCLDLRPSCWRGGSGSLRDFGRSRADAPDYVLGVDDDERGPGNAYQRGLSAFRRRSCPGVAYGVGEGIPST